MELEPIKGRKIINMLAIYSMIIMIMAVDAENWLSANAQQMHKENNN